MSLLVSYLSRALFKVLLFLAGAFAVIAAIVGLLMVETNIYWKTVRLEMPGGSYFAAHMSWWSFEPPSNYTAFFHVNGKLLMQPNVYGICFNDNIVIAHVYPPGEDFVYIRGEDEVRLRPDNIAEKHLDAKLKSHYYDECSGNKGGQLLYFWLAQNHSDAKIVPYWEWMFRERGQTPRSKE